METIQEQIEYGSFCKHGTALGTPGGADIMCQLCEIGLDTWVPDPTYRFIMILKHNGTSVEVRRIGPWHESDINTGAGWAKLTRLAEIIQEVPDISDHFEFAAEKTSEGYWDA